VRIAHGILHLLDHHYPLNFKTVADASAATSVILMRAQPPLSSLYRD
jgi:hypothetical protein